LALVRDTIDGLGAPQAESLIRRRHSFARQHLGNSATHGLGSRDAVASAEVAQSLKLHFRKLNDSPHGVII